ncbi:ABC transporter ATP-binding protein [Parapusillimonas granuli]|nr:ABC transporter ATP-binding protein [Parapusillimonas granuli]
MSIQVVDMSSPARAAAAKLSINAVSKRYGSLLDGVVALEPVDMAIADGDFVCIVGPSGCGKSTLLNIIAGFESPTSGAVMVAGNAINAPGPERGVVFQQGALFNWMTVLDNVAFGPQALGWSAAQARETAMRHLDLVGLASFAHRYPYELSGGMQQRVAIARALANEPEVLLMDEPFAALDHQTRELLQEEIHRIWKGTGKTIVWITHSIDEALYLATHIVVMSARPGRVKAAFQTTFGDSADPFISTTPEFVEAKRQIVALLREESIEAQRQEAMK